MFDKHLIFDHGLKKRYQVEKMLLKFAYSILFILMRVYVKRLKMDHLMNQLSI